MKRLAYTLLILALLPLIGRAQTYTPSPSPFLLAQDNSGRIINNACIWTYLAGTTTAVDTYSNSLGSANTNPIRSDSAGRFSAFLVPGLAYKFVYESACTPPSHGTVLRTADNIPGVPIAHDAGVNDFRLTFSSGNPVPTSDVTGATTVYATPYKGNKIAVYDTAGTVTVFTSPELSIAIPATTNTVYDVFAYSNATTLALALLPWTNDTTRSTSLERWSATGTLVLSTGHQYRYLGTFRTTGSSGQSEDSVAKRYLWNYYNRVRRNLYVLGSSSWNYTTDTWRQANANTAYQIDLVNGVQEDVLDVRVQGLVTNSSGMPTSTPVGIGQDSTSATMAASLYGPVELTGTYSVITVPVVASASVAPAVGRHYYTWLERSEASGTTTWYGVLGGYGQSGIFGSWLN